MQQTTTGDANRCISVALVSVLARILSNAESCETVYFKPNNDRSRTVAIVVRNSTQSLSLSISCAACPRINYQKSECCRS